MKKNVLRGIVLLSLLVVAAPSRAARTPRGIALDFAMCFEDRTPKNTRLGGEWPLSVRCQCLVDADRQCVAAGYKPGCWRDGWSDADHDAFGVAACDDRARRGL